MRNPNRDFAEIAKSIKIAVMSNPEVQAAMEDHTCTETAISTEVRHIIQSTLGVFDPETEIFTETIPQVTVTMYGHGSVRLTLKAPGFDDNGDLIALTNNIGYNVLTENKIFWILWWQFRQELRNRLGNTDVVQPMDVYSDDSYVRIHLTNLMQLLDLLDAIETAEFTADNLAFAVSYYNELLPQYYAYHERQEQIDRANRVGNGLSSRIRDKASQALSVEEWDAVEAQIQKYQVMLQNEVVVRTWGWEVEAPNPGSGVRTPSGVDKGMDGSVESYEYNNDDCECDCRDCRYHECNCGNCEDYNDSPDHCNDSSYCNQVQSYEFRTTGGITRVLHPGLKELLDQIKDTEKNETAGTHIHVFAKDLSAFQLGTVLGAYAATQRIWDVLAGRNAEDDARCETYANHIPVEYVSATLRADKLHHVGKFFAINTHHVNNERGTLEFRQMNCNYDFHRISFMAWMARGLIQSVKNGAKLNEFFSIKDIAGFVDLYAKYGFDFDHETDEIENPYGSRYRQVKAGFEVA